MGLEDDVSKAKAAGKTALDDLNKAEGWIDAHPRLGAAAFFAIGFLVGAVAIAIHLHK